MLATLFATALLLSADPVLLDYGSNARISPDGKNISYLQSGTRRIKVMSIDGKLLGTSHELPTLTTPIPTSKERRILIQGVEWSGNGKLIYVIQSEEDLSPSTSGGDYWFLNKSVLSSWQVSLGSAPLLSDRKELDASTEEIHKTVRRDRLGGLAGVTRSNGPEPKTSDIDESIGWSMNSQFRVYIHNTFAGKTNRLTKTSDLNDVKLLPLEQGLLIATMRKVELKTEKGKPFLDSGYTKYVDASSDSDVIAYERRGNIIVYRRSSEQTTEVRLDTVCHSILSLSLSPDGSTIVFSGFEIKNGEETYKSAVYKVSTGV